jgi:hypothetical protein
VSDAADVGLAAVCEQQPDGVVSIKGKPNGYLVTTEPHADYRLTLEWRWLAPKGNSGVLLHIEGPDKVDRVWPKCLQFQMKTGAAGDLIPMAGFAFAEMPAKDAKNIAHRAPDSEKPVGEWNRGEITCRGDSVECVVNGVLQNRATRCSVKRGSIGIQLEGAPFALRNVVLTPLDER